MSEQTNDELRRRIAEVRGIDFDVYDFVVGDPSLVYKDSNDDIPNWPVNIADAWEMVEEMNKTCFTFLSFQPTPGWEFKIKDTSSEGWGWYSGYSDTAPRAICLAWLEWKRACSANSDSTP